MPRARKYPQELIERGVRLALESGRPIAHVGRDLGIAPETLRKAVRQAEADSGRRGELLSSQEREEIKALRREVKDLRRANEILKPPRCFLPRSSTQTERSERLCARAPGALWGRADLQDPDPQAARRPDLVERDFTASAPNELWVADFSYLRCWEGVVFFSFVIDVYSRKVVGWQFASHMRTTLVLDALRMALSTRERVEEIRLIHHSDRGSQYVSGD